MANKIFKVSFNEGCKTFYSVYSVSVSDICSSISVKRLCGPAISFSMMVCGLMPYAVSTMTEKRFLKSVLEYNRTDRWFVKTYEGMSGSKNYVVRHNLDNSGYWKNSRALHESMYGKFNEDLDEYFVPDFLEIGLEIFKKDFTGTFHAFLSGNTPDWIEEIKEERHDDAHRGSSNFIDAINAFDNEHPIFADDEEIIDYSEYTPVEEEDPEELFTK